MIEYINISMKSFKRKNLTTVFVNLGFFHRQQVEMDYPSKMLPLTFLNISVQSL